MQKHKPNQNVIEKFVTRLAIKLIAIVKYMYIISRDVPSD